MPRRKKKSAPTKAAVAAGVFEPAVPQDAHDVLKLFAVAVRASCAVPAEVENVSRRLRLATSPLTPLPPTSSLSCCRTSRGGGGFSAIGCSLLQCEERWSLEHFIGLAQGIRAHIYGATHQNRAQ